MATEGLPRRLGSGWPIWAGLVLVVAIGGAVLSFRHTDETPASVAARPARQTSPPSAIAPEQHTAAAAQSAASEASAQAPTGSAPSNPAAPSFDIVRVNPQGGAVIAGRAQPGAQVVVRDGSQELGHTQADRNGEFVLVPTARLPAGGRELTLAAREGTSAEVKGDGSVVVVVPPRPATTASEPAQPAVALLVPETGAPRLLQAPKNPAGKLSLDTVDYDEHGEIRFTGSARPAASLRVYVDNAPVGDARTDTRGQWSLTPQAAMSPGLHNFRVDLLAASGQVLGRVELPFQRSAMPSTEVALGRVVVQPGQNLWRIARHAYGAGIRYTVIYLANHEQIRDPRLIYPGQVFATPGANP